MLHPYAYYLVRAARENPDGLAVNDLVTSTAYTWRQLADRVERTAHELTRMGVRPDDRVAVVQANRASYLELILAVGWCGAAFVPILRTLGDKGRVEISELADVRLTLDAVEDTALAGRGRPGLAPAHRSPSATAQILFTSGSTGTPKGVVHTLSTTEAAIAGWTQVSGYDRDQVVLVTTPINHAAGRWVESALVMAGTIVLIDNARASTILDATAECAVTHMILVPTVLQELVDSGRLVRSDIASLRRVLYASSPAAPSLIRRAQEQLGPILHTVYGSTEAPAPCTHLDASEHELAATVRPELLQSCGREVSNLVQLRFVDPDGHDVAEGEMGELAIRSPFLSVGYWQQPEVWQARMRQEWFMTGDLGRRERGYVYLTDRRDDMIITGGWNVYPLEVENVLAEHLAVREVAVIGEPHPRWGESVLAVVSLKESVPEASLLSHCRERLTAYKVPKRVVVLDDLPKSGHSKVSRSLVRRRVLGAVQNIHGAQ